MGTDRSIADEETGIELLYRGSTLQDIPFENVDKFNSLCRELGVDMLQTHPDWGTDYIIPEEYKEIDITEYVIEKLMEKSPGPSTDKIMRVKQELDEYNARNLFPVLQLMIYIVDGMRKNNIVWGVGRGSSVASYVLYLIGIHKIDSFKYDLDLKEFLK